MAVFDGKVALVTGGSSGIGRATAIAFANEGAKVVVADVQVNEGEKTVHLVQAAGSDGFFIKTDVSQAADVEAMVEQTVKEYGRLDYAFNNAGITNPSKFLPEQTEETFDRLMSINLKGTWLSMKYEIPQMLSNGGGAIVNMSSIAGVTGFKGGSIYSASKYGVIGLTKSAALEYAQSNIRINAVGPGTIYTPMIEDFIHMAGDDPNIMEQIRASHPIGRDGKPEEVANAAVWLCSGGSSFVTGHLLLIDGGFTAQ